ncbi:hypothetical protein ACFV5N_04175 [Streptomyces sp. NPDC059853]|uniref:hypothetical protein n=1 Tax=Streptomyces sp. NPDC059853 TaxID=3346973 RepID=UPI00365E5205
MTGRLTRLYPAGYRAAYGAEIAATHRELTAGLGRVARWRADAELAGHAVRVRLGLDAAAPGGRLLACAAPFALAAGAVVGALEITRWYTGLVVSPAPASLLLITLDPGWALHLLCSLLLCVGAVVALTGHRRAGVAAVVCGQLGTVALWPVVGEVRGGGVVVPVVALLTALVVPAAPGDLPPEPDTVVAAGVVAGAGWFPVAAVGTGGFPVSTEYGAWPLLVLAGTALVLAVRRGSPGLYEVAAVLPASLPLIGRAYQDAWQEWPPVLGLWLVLPLALGCAALVRGVRARRLR